MSSMIAAPQLFSPSGHLARYREGRAGRVEKSVRVLGCVIVANTTVIAMKFFQYYSAGPSSRAVTGSVALAAAILTWLATE